MRRIVGAHGFRTPADLAALLPDGLPEDWTTRDVAERAAIPRRTAQQMAYVLRANGLAVEIGRGPAGVVYRRAV